MLSLGDTVDLLYLSTDSGSFYDLGLFSFFKSQRGQEFKGSLILQLSWDQRSFDPS